MKVAMQRAADGLGLEFARQLYDGIKAGGEVGPAVREAMVNAALAKLRPHVVAALRRAGLVVPDDVELTPDALREAINASTGLQIETLDPDGIKAAINDRVAARLSEVLGVEVTQVMDPDALRAEVRAAAVRSVQSGRASALLSAVDIRRLRESATWVRAGIGPDDRRKYLLRWYQKKFRRTHREVWDRVSNMGGA